MRLLDAATATLPDVARHWEEIGTKRYLRFLADDMAKAEGSADIDWDFYAKVFLLSIAGLHRTEPVERSLSEEESIAFADNVIGMIQRAIERTNKQ